MKKVLIIAGHHLARLFPPHLGDTGAVIEGDNEHDFAERLCIPAYEELKRLDYNVELCDFRYNLKQKIKYANNVLTDRDCIVSVHMNAARDERVTGSEVFYETGARRSNIYAKNIAKITSDTTGIKNRGHKPDIQSHHGYLGIIRNTVSYDFLLELGFLTNPDDREQVEKYGVQAIIDTCKYLLDKKT